VGLHGPRTAQATAFTVAAAQFAGQVLLPSSCNGGRSVTGELSLLPFIDSL
jgi:hypothetical protein